MRKPPDGSNWLSLFTGPTKQEVWRRFAAEVGAEWCPGGLSAPSCIQFRHGRWTATLDSPNGFDGSAYLRVRAPFVSREGIRFDLSATNLAGLLRHWRFVDLSSRWRERSFGSLMVNQGNLSLLAHLWSVPGMETAVEAARPRWIGCTVMEGYPPSLRMLSIHIPGPALSPQRLHSIRNLTLSLADGIDTLNGSERDSVQALIDDLLAPTCQIREIGYPALWDGTRVCLRAARLLGAAADSHAGPALLDVLRDNRVPIRIGALKALGEIGDSMNAPEVIPFVGHRNRLEREVSAAAAEALHRLGYGELARRLEAVIEECADPHPLDADFRGPCVLALTRALASPRTGEVVNAATALCVLGAAEAVPEISAAQRRLDPREETATAILGAIIKRMSVSASLPRPATPPAPPTLFPAASR